MSRMLHDFIVCFQALTNIRGGSMQHGRDMTRNISRRWSQAKFGEIRCSRMKFDIDA